RLDGIAHGRKQRRPVLFYRVKGAGAYQGLDAAAIDRMPIHSTAEIEQAGVWAVFVPDADDLLDRSLSRALDGAQAVTHRAGRLALGGIGVGYRLETVGRGIDVGRQNLDAVGQRVFPEYLYLVGIVHVGRQGGKIGS